MMKRKFLPILLLIPLSANSQAVKRKPLPTSPPGTTDIVALVKRLQALNPFKGEFETKDQYEARMATLPVPRGTLTLRADDPSFNYDADAKEMRFVLQGDEADLCLSVPAGTPRERIPVICNSSDSEYTVKKVFLRRGSYIGGNAFGAKKVIELSEYDDYGVLIVGSSPIQVNTTLRTADFIFFLPVEEAKAIESFLGVELLGEVAEPSVDSGMTGHRPTLEEPYETRIHASYVRFRLDSVRIVDKRTGRVVANFNAGVKVVPGMVYRLPRR